MRYTVMYIISQNPVILSQDKPSLVGLHRAPIPSWLRRFRSFSVAFDRDMCNNPYKGKGRSPLSAERYKIEHSPSPMSSPYAFLSILHTLFSNDFPVTP